MAGSGRSLIISLFSELCWKYVVDPLRDWGDLRQSLPRILRFRAEFLKGNCRLAKGLRVTRWVGSVSS